ncbi:MAG: exodeoxyribonuclease III [Coriobacteriales bacterium]|nr:exodeoxyribonuclease III [Coriobacteriales bacterium]
MSDTPSELRLVSWNVNGLRAVMKKEPSFEEIFSQVGADVFALQETKLQDDQRAKLKFEPEGYYQTWNYAERKGYSGTAVFSREEPSQVIRQIGCEVADDEGRICALEFEKYWFVDVYTPNAQDGLKRLDTRMTWDARFREFLSELSAQKPVITCGDYNVAHKEIDLKNPDTNHKNPGFSDEERESFGKLLDAGFVDTFRLLYPDLEDAYSWWSYRMRARARNVGWRIDYFLVSERISDRVREAAILSDIFGSDHCPVELDIEL